MNSLVWIILDSCRYDTFIRARKPNVERLEEANRTRVDKRYSYASWTAPSHLTFLMGMVPHAGARHVLASEVYRGEFARWSERLGTGSALDFSDFLPHLSLPKVLRGLGYRTIARVSLPVLNEATLLATHFDDYRLMDNHNDFAGMVREMTFDGDAPRFYFLNLGETHYPYMLDDDADLPRISGVHGVFRALGSEARGSDGPRARCGSAFPDEATMRRLHDQQVACVEYIDTILGELFAKCPPDTHIILTADHGEMFGEDGYFGHGPVMHEKVFEVPFIEGRVPRGG